LISAVVGGEAYWIRGKPLKRLEFHIPTSSILDKFGLAYYAALFTGSAELPGLRVNMRTTPFHHRFKGMKMLQVF
jgi:hypothetical protein